MTIPSVGIVTSEQIRTSRGVASSRIRAEWMIRHWPDAELYTIGVAYSTVIFQKAYWIEYARSFNGIKILDVCDPDILHWNSPCKDMADHCDAVVTSSEALRELLARYTSTPVICIPDRLDLAEFSSLRKDHSGNGRSRTAAWLGYSVNYHALEVALPALIENTFESLIVISTAGDPFVLPKRFAGQLNLVNYAWHQNTVYQHLLEADILLNFSLSFGKWKYKSNNKTLVGWALGMPVARTASELSQLTSEEARAREGDMRMAEMYGLYDVRTSVLEYKALIDHLRKGNSATPQ